MIYCMETRTILFVLFHMCSKIRAFTYLHNSIHNLKLPKNAYTAKLILFTTKSNNRKHRTRHLKKFFKKLLLILCKNYCFSARKWLTFFLGAFSPINPLYSTIIITIIIQGAILVELPHDLLAFSYFCEIFCHYNYTRLYFLMGKNAATVAALCLIYQALYFSAKIYFS